MLEELAQRFVALSESEINAVSYLLVIVGGVAAGLLNKSNAELERAPYFASTAIVVFLATCAQAIWLQSAPALAGGYLWIIVLASLLISAAAGYFVGKFAIARSYSAYGHGRRAALGFIPIANLALLLTAPRVPNSPARVPQIPLLSGGYGVAVGIFLIAASTGASNYMKAEAERMVKDSQSDPANLQASIAAFVKVKGIPETLRVMSNEAKVPFAIDPITTLAKVEAEGTQLRRTYVVTGQLNSLSESFRGKIADGLPPLE